MNPLSASLDIYDVADMPAEFSRDALRVPVEVKPKPRNPYYFDDSQIVLKVEEKIYKIHRYFLVRESEFFEDLFSLPQGDSETVEGVHDENPICVPDTPIEEFDNLLRFFYFGMHDDYILTVADWIAMLSISTRLNFPRVRERAIKELTARLDEIDPFDLIGLAVKYDVQQWLMPAYRRIVTGGNLITHEEAEKIPFPMAVMLMRSREQHWKDHRSRHYSQTADQIINSEVTVMHLVSSAASSYSPALGASSIMYND